MQLVASYLYIVCQALDLRAMNSAFHAGLITILDAELSTHFGTRFNAAGPATSRKVRRAIVEAVKQSLDTQALIMDVVPRMQTAIAATTTPLVDFLAEGGVGLEKIPAFRAKVVEQTVALLTELREEFLSGKRGPAPAKEFLGRTRPVYEYVRCTLGVKMHGNENITRFDGGFTQETIGQNVSKIYEVRCSVQVFSSLTLYVDVVRLEAIRDGKMQDVIANLF